MSARKPQKKKSVPVEVHVPAVEDTLALEQEFKDNINVAELDLINDLDDDFFGISYELVQRLVPINSFAAIKIKRFVDLLARMHSHYAEEVAASAEMQEKVKEAQKKLRLTMELTGTSTDMVEKMRESLAEAWRVADASQLREAVLYSHIRYAYSDHPKQSMDIGFSKNQSDMRFRGLVFRERDRLARELKEHQKRLETNRVYSESVEYLVDEQRRTITRQQNRVKIYENEVFKLEHKIRLCVENYQEKINAQKREIDQLTQAVQGLRLCERKLLECTAHKDNLKQLIERLSHDNFALQKTNHRAEEEMHQLKTTIKNLESDNRALRREKIELDLRGRSNLREMKKKEEVYLVLRRRFYQLSKKNNELEDRSIVQKNVLTATEKKLMLVTAQVEDVQRQRDDGERARDKLRAEIANMNDAMGSLRFDLAAQRERTQDVQNVLNRANVMLDEKDASMHKITKERNDLLMETNELNKTIETLEDNVSVKAQKLLGLQEQLQRQVAEFHEVKQQMETLRSEKTILQKSYAVCGRDRQTLQNLNSKHAFQIIQLCNQVAVHEKEAITMKNQIDQLHNLVKHKLSEIHSKERQLKSVRTELYEMKMRSVQLQNTIEEDERRFKQITISLEEERKAKDLVGQQMMRRNDELRLLQEKLSMMQLALNRGTTQYNQRIEDIRLLKTEITNLRMSKDCLERSVASTADMRHEVVRLERQLIRERLHVAAFTDEMKHPYRIHRWRVIRGKDPLKYELICKIQVLLKRNIRLDVERRNLENKVQEVKRLYDILKQQLQYAADPSTKERLWRQQRINQRQSRKVRAMKAELAINEIDLQTRDVIIGEYQNALKKQKRPNPIIVQCHQSESSLNSEKYEEQVFSISTT